MSLSLAAVVYGYGDTFNGFAWAPAQRWPVASHNRTVGSAHNLPEGLLVTGAAFSEPQFACDRIRI